MKKLIRRIATPSNVMAATALFVALGGVSYAAVKLPRNSVGTPQLRANAVTGVKIKNHSVGAADLAGNAVTGAAIKESSLTTVPSALKADSATTATTAGSATTADDSAKLGGVAAAGYATNARLVRVFKSLNAGDADVKIVENGPISVMLHCENSGGSDRYSVYSRTTVDGAVQESNTDDLLGDGAASTFLNVATLTTDSEMVKDNTTTGDKTTVSGYDTTAILFDSTGTKAIEMVEGTSGHTFNHFGSTCTFTGQFLVLDKG